MISTAIKAAKAAGKILMDNYGKVVKIDVKSDSSLVTNADIECEKKIKEVISEKYPNHGFICEEGGLSKQSADYVWVIDPLDGTHNYIFGSPIFGVSIALAYKKELMIGVAYFPVLNQLFTAEKGKGSFLNGKRLEVSNRKLGKGVMGLSSGDLKLVTEYFIKFADKIIKKSFGARITGCASYNISSIATKRFDVMVEATAHIWDVAAGVVIVQEANGLVTDFQGKPITLDSKNFLATNKINHKEVLELL